MNLEYYITLSVCDKYYGLLLMSWMSQLPLSLLPLVKKFPFSLQSVFCVHLIQRFIHVLASLPILLLVKFVSFVTLVSLLSRARNPSAERTVDQLYDSHRITRYETTLSQVVCDIKEDVRGCSRLPKTQY